MAQRRRCTAKFKTQVILELLTGRRRMAQLCREHDLKEQVVDTKGEGQLERIADLERLVGRLTMALDSAKKASQLWGSRAPRSGS